MPAPGDHTYHDHCIILSFYLSWVAKTQFTHWTQTYWAEYAAAGDPMADSIIVRGLVVAQRWAIDICNWPLT